MKKTEHIEEVVKCPECGSATLSRDYKRAELVCDDCGFVLDDNQIYPGPDWRAFDKEQREKRAHTGAPMIPTIHDKGLSTVIGLETKDSYGKSLSTEGRARLYRLRKWQRRIRVSDSMARNLAKALREIDRVSSAMLLPRIVRETSAMIYRKAVHKHMIRGRTIEVVVAATVYAACRQCNVPRTLDEISKQSRVSRRELGRTHRFIARELSLKLLPTSPEDYVSRFCNKMNLSISVQEKTKNIIAEATKEGLTVSRQPNGITAATIYIAAYLCGERVTQEEVADTCCVTEVTIRSRYKEILKRLDMKIDI